VRPQGHRGPRPWGQGLGAEPLDWAGTRAADEGDDGLRVDVWTTNERLQHYYLHQGFTYVRTVVLPTTPPGTVPAASTAHPSATSARGREPCRLATSGAPANSVQHDGDPTASKEDAEGLGTSRPSAVLVNQLAN